MLVTTNLGNSQIPRLVSWTPAKARFDSVIGQCLVAKLLGGNAMFQLRHRKIEQNWWSSDRDAAFWQADLGSRSVLLQVRSLWHGMDSKSWIDWGTYSLPWHICVQVPGSNNHKPFKTYKIQVSKGSQFWSQTMAQPSTIRLELSHALLTLRRAQSLNIQVRASHVGMQDDEACRAESFGFALSFGFGSVNPGYMILWWWSDMI